MPSRFKGKVEKYQWQLLKLMVTRDALADARDFKNIMLTPDEIHTHAANIMDYILERGLLKPGSVDDMGGCGPLVLKAHALNKVSLDRIDNLKPHFSPGEPTLSNLQLVPHGINTYLKIPTIDTVLEAVRTAPAISPKTTKKLSDDCAKTRKASIRNIYYRKKERNGKTEYKDLECHKAFKTHKDFQEYANALFLEQHGRCNVSRAPLRPGPKCWAQASLDAIYPRLGHVPGNLRWICATFQNSNCDAVKTFDAADDEPTRWTSQTWDAYCALVQLCRRLRFRCPLFSKRLRASAAIREAMARKNGGKRKRI